MGGVHRPEQDIDIDIGSLLSSLVRDWVRILVVAVCVAAVAFMFATTATRHYKAETRILIETRESVFTRQEQPGSDSSLLDEQGIGSQVEVLTSSDLLKQVARDLNLAAISEFNASGATSTLGRLMIIAGLKSDPAEVPPEERVLKAFREKLTVYRVDRSRVIVVEFSSEDPALAAIVPNAVADAYIALQRDAKLQSNADATEWLEPEIADLRDKVKEAEGKVAAYRSQSDLLLGNNNAMLSTQQLSELSTELSRVRANRSSAEATASAFRQSLADGASIDTLPGVLSSPLIQRLSESQVQLKAQIADLSATLLDNHPRIRSLRSQLADLDGQIRNAARNVLEGLEAEASAARQREQQLVADLNRLKAESSRADGQQVELRALEREANAQRELLESYLVRYREAMSRTDRNYLPADARIFSRATTPSEPYFPKIIPITIAAFAASILLMIVVTLMRELFSGRAMRSTYATAPEPVPLVVMPHPAAGKAAVVAEEAMPADDVVGEEEMPVMVARPLTKGQITIQAAAEKLIAGGASRAVFVSPEGDEGAAVSVMVAREIADAGLRVLLLDLTASGAASEPMLDGEPMPGITNLLCSEAQFTEIIHEDLYSDSHVIPVGTADAARAMRAVDRLPIIMDSLTTAYDIVIVECGPADVASLQRIVAGAADIFVSVIDEDDEAVSETANELKAGGFAGALLVTPSGYVPPAAPEPDSRSVAA
jgi:uncharacterized protein involved in exopolysaccharide biosynthesis/Mrp family chromosome partitioning ATPase